MSFLREETPIGSFTLDDFTVERTRIHLGTVQIVENLGPDSTFRWSADQHEVLFQVAAAMGVTLECIVPGGWIVSPPELRHAFFRQVVETARSVPVTGRWTPAFG